MPTIFRLKWKACTSLVQLSISQRAARAAGEVRGVLLGSIFNLRKAHGINQGFM